MKKNFALRVDEEVFAALERWAADEFRSVNGQIEWILNEALKKAKRTLTSYWSFIIKASTTCPARTSRNTE